MNNDIIKKIQDAYKNLGYLDKYADSVLFTILILFVFFIIISYLITNRYKKEILADWDNQKCKPTVMPFAGMIQGRDDAMKYTEENFQFCAESIMMNFINTFFKPIHDAMGQLTNVIKVVENVIQMIRKLFSSIRDLTKEFASKILGTVLNAITPLRIVLTKIKDILGKSHATLITGVYTIIANFLAMNSMFGATIEGLLVILIALAGTILGLEAIPLFGTVIAIPFIIVFIAILVPTIIVISIAAKTFKYNVLRSVPGL